MMAVNNLAAATLSNSCKARPGAVSAMGAMGAMGAEERLFRLVPRGSFESFEKCP